MEAKQSLGSRLESRDRVGVWDQVKGRRLDEGVLKSSQMQAQPLPEVRDWVAARDQVEDGGLGECEKQARGRKLGCHGDGGLSGSKHRVSRRGRRMEDSNLVWLNRGERTKQQVAGGEGVASCVRPRCPAASPLCGCMEGSHDGDARPRAFTMFPVHLPSPLCSPCPTSDTP